MSERNLRLYIDDIKIALKRIEEYIKDLSSQEFFKDSKTVDAVIRNLSILGEAAKNIPDEVKSKYSGIPWEEVVGMRNKIIHEYFGVDESILWKTIKEDLPVFKKQIIELSKTL